MRTFLKGWIVTTLAVLIAAELVSGITFTPRGLVLATLVLGILNAIVRPILIVLALPAIVLTLGLFLLVINALLLWVVGHMKEFHVDGFGTAFLGALVISVVSMILNRLIFPKSEPRSQRVPRRPPPPPPDSGSGPIIDVK